MHFTFYDSGLQAASNADATSTIQLQTDHVPLLPEFVTRDRGKSNVDCPQSPQHCRLPPTSILPDNG
jgi:hypothetical protein